MCTNLSKTNMTQAMAACRTCLTTERKLYSIYDENLCETFKNLIGITVSLFDGLPQYVCNYCAILLLKFKAFRKSSQQAQSFFESAKFTNMNKNLYSETLNNKILPNVLSRHPVTLQKSVIQIIDTTQPNEITELKSNINYQYIESLDFNDNSGLNLKHDRTGLNLTDPMGLNQINDPTDLDYANDNEDLDYGNNSPQNYSEACPDINKIELPEFDIPPKRSKRAKLKDNPTKITSKLDSNPNKSLNEKRKGKYFESDENLRKFERDFNVDVIILSPEQQMKDVLERKLSSNYLHSPYKCELCFKGVMDEESLKKHVLNQHDPETARADGCEICHSESLYGEEVQKTVLCSRGPIVCSYCSFRYKDKRGLNQHLKSHRLKFACRQCSYVSRTTFNAKEHFKMHTGYTHECKHCGKSYEKLSSHLTHLRIHHPSHFIWCDICGEAFIGDFGLNAHKKRAHRHLSLPFECSSCAVRFTTEAALNRHTAQNNCSMNICIHCGDSFNRKMELRDHLLEKHRSLKVYECEKCNKTFSRQSLHSAHYRRAHIDAKDKRKVSKPWVCEVCGKTLPNRCVLLYHQRNHTGEKPYQCTQCSKSFTMRKLLQSHLRVHTSDRPYVCKSCPKAFKGLSALRAHEHIHTGGQKKTTSKGRKV